MYCSKCNKESMADAMFCEHCGAKIAASKKRNTADFKKYKKYIIITVIAVVVIVYIFVFRCMAGVCLLPRSFNGDYCSIHTCDSNNCYNKVAKENSYCYTHMPSAYPRHTYKPEVAEDVLSFSDIEVTQNSVYTVCTATIKNTGRKKYTFIEVKGKFKNSSGTVIDTDWTYAVGSEGLAPGESKSFRLSVDKNSNIKKCDFEILDYEKE